MTTYTRSILVNPTPRPSDGGANQSQQAHSLISCFMSDTAHGQPSRTAAVTAASAAVPVTPVEPSPSMIRRSGNFQRSAWDYSRIVSSTNDPTVNSNYREHERLKEEIKRLLKVAEAPLEKAELVDTLQQFGVTYHFEDEIHEVLGSLFVDATNIFFNIVDLHSTALLFKVLRGNGYKVSQDVFKRFLYNIDGSIKMSDIHGCNIEGILNLYEASFLGFEGEDILVKAQIYTSKCLEDHIQLGKVDTNIAKRVRHVLQLPTHWRMSRFEARWFIDLNETTINVNPLIFQFARLDFNMLQDLHRQELRELTMWWNSVCVVDELDFARDRVVESYLCSMGLAQEPMYGQARKYLTQATSLLYVIDDMYDVYGSIDELGLFTKAIERWDVNAIENLPNYMRICFLLLFNMVNESAYHILKEKKVFVMQYIKKVWVDLCKAYLIEAKWYHNKQIPGLEEYMRNASKSTGIYLAVSYIYIFTSQHISTEVLNSLDMTPSLINWSGNVFRLNNDLHTSSKELERGDVLKAVECCMHENNISRSAAQLKIQSIIVHTWRKINEEQYARNIPQNIYNGCINLCRASHWFYLTGDGYGAPGKEQVKSLLFDSA